VALDIPNGRPEGRATATYAELAESAAAVQHRLASVVTGESLVALLFPRTSLATYACQLGVMQAGAAYVSLDPALPDARLVDIITDASAVAILTDEQHVERARQLGLDASRVIVATDDRRDIDRPAATPPAWLGPETLAYVIYTSGTTGRPKGVMIEHRAIVNLIATDVADLEMRPGDRVAQTSSHSYDSSVEEIWMAFAAGATLVVLDDVAVRAGPDVLPWLERERITVWCPSPTLLRATGCRRPEATPRGIRLVYVGGEAMPPDVVSVWAPGRRLVNGYGPTECAVVATRAEMRPGRPISIGRPIANNLAWVLAGVNGDLREAAPGERGELCLGGRGLARGYWRAPGLTAAKFIEHPRLGRLYRTGDLASRTADGELFCYGRRDSQVKVRGHRVELEDVESHLARLPGVRAAACALRGHSLVALVVALEPGSPPAPDALGSAMSAELPSHMVPTRFTMVEALPMTAGGKLDRPAVSGLVDALTEPAPTTASAAPTDDPLEALVVACVERALGLAGRVSVNAHFFDDLGADSLGAAELVTALREHDETAGLTVRDLYGAPTARRLAAKVGQDAARGPSHSPVPAAGSRSLDPAAPASASPSAIRMAVLQTIWLTITFVANAALLGVIAVVVLPSLAMTLGLVPFLLASPLLAALAYLARAGLATVFTVAVKRRLIGRYTPRREPVWGTFHFRNWVVQRAACRMPWSLAAGTEFQAMLLRLLGARIGRDVQLLRGVDLTTGGWDLLTIGDNVTLNQDAALRLVEIEHGFVTAGPITIEDDVTIEVRAGVGPNTHLGRGAALTALSSLSPGARIPAGARWTGVPAEPDGLALPRPAITRAARELSPVAHGLVMVAARLGTTLLFTVPIVAVSAGLALFHQASAADVLAWLASPSLTRTSAVTIVALTAAPLVLTLFLDLMLVRALGPIAPGVISPRSLEYVRVWVKTHLVNQAGPWLSGALAWRTWLVAAGMRVGRHAELSTVIDVIPEQVSIGEGVFLTDGVYLGGPRADRGTVTMASTRLGDRVFVGNHAVIPCGQRVPDEVLIGVCTVADDSRLEARSAWFGHPAFALARRPEEIDGSAFAPSWPRYVARLFFEAARFALPLAPVLVTIVWLTTLLRSAALWPPALVFLWVAPGVTLASAGTLCLFVLALKWTLLGRVKPGRHDFWSCWCFRWDLLYVAWQQLARPLLTGLEGTLLLAWYLRAMGARIGRRVLLGRGFAQVVDPDMLQFDDDATVRGLLQAHTFEGRVLKIDRVRVRGRATVGSQALLFYGTDVGAGTRVGAHSVVMKRERLPAGQVYEGCPTRLRATPAEG